MPRAFQTPEEIDLMRNKILDAAAKLIVEEGFNKLTMRKIASRLKVTATNIYYYFANKDEINVMIRIKAFKLLLDMQRSELNKFHSPEDQFRALVWAFVKFGTQYPDYFDIMYNLRLPKYTNYRGSKFERTASYEKDNSIKTFLISIDTLIDLKGQDVETLDDYLEYKYLAIKIWSDLHGIISIYNSGVLFEVEENQEEILNRRVNDLIDETIKKSGRRRPRRPFPPNRTAHTGQESHPSISDGTSVQEVVTSG